MSRKKKQEKPTYEMPTLTYKEARGASDPDRPSNNPLYPELKVKERAYRTPEEFAAKISEYFYWCADYKDEVMSASGQIKEISRPLTPTIEEMAAYLGLARRSLQDYDKRPGYDYILEQAREFILGRKMSSLINGKGSSAGLIFDLTNNYGMKHAWESKEEKILRVIYEDESAKALPNKEGGDDAGSGD